MAVQPVPEGYHTLTPYLIVKKAAAALEFYANALGATELFRLADPSGKIGHAEMKIGDSAFMLADEFPDMGAVAPQKGQGHAVSFLVYVSDVDAAYARAIDAGCTVVKPVKDQFYGDRSGTFVDPFGHMWTLATHVEDVPPDEMQRRIEAMTSGAPGSGT
jgi:PhnB protein